jgi:hypothetical protein
MKATPRRTRISRSCSQGTSRRKDRRHSRRRNGQSYAFFGASARLQFGFTTVRIRKAEQAFIDSMLKLHETGSIPENKP